MEEVVDTEEEDNDGSDTIDSGDLQEHVREELEVLATCMDNGENGAAIPGVDNSQTACLKLAELPEALAIVQARRGASKNKPTFPWFSWRQGQKLDNHLDDNAYPALRRISDRMMTDQLRSSEGPNELGHSLSNAEARICEQRWAGHPQCPDRPVDVIELEDAVQEFEPNQDEGMRQILSVQVDVSDVRLLRPSTRCVIATKRRSPRCHRHCSPLHSS